MSKSKIFALVIASVVLSSAAAADGYEPVGKGFAPPPVYSWTGLYAGLNGGYGWSESGSITTSADTLQFCGAGCTGGQAAATASALGASGVFPLNTDGVSRGVQIGHNWQWGNTFVVGIEADIQKMSGSDSANSATVTPLVVFTNNSISTDLSVTKAIDYLGTLRGRLGFLVKPTLLVYGTGGLAYGKVESSTSISQVLNGPTAGIATAWGSSGSFSDTRTGWTAGGGGEWMVGPNASLKFEGLYYDLGSETYSGGTLVDSFAPPGPGPGGAPAFFTNAVQSRTDDYKGYIVRVGVNAHF